MQIDSLQFGKLDIDANKVIDFPAGLPGFTDHKRFALVHADDNNSPLYTLHSVDDPAIAFSVASPDHFGLHYEFELNDDESNLLQTNKVEDIALLLILRHDGPSQETPVKASLSAPLVINTINRRGIQKIVGRMGCDITLRALS